MIQSTSRYAGLAALVLITFILASLAGCRSNDRETSATATSSRVSPTATLSILEPREVNIGTGSALVWGSGRYGVVLVHGAIYDAASWTDQAVVMAESGFSVVAVENATADDVWAAADYLRRSYNVAAVALVGASAGTGPVLAVASDVPPESWPVVDLVVILAGSGNVDELAVPSVLFISAADDGGAATAAQRMLAATSADPVDLLIVPGSAHAQALFNEPEGAQVLETLVARLLERREVLAVEP